MKPSNSKSQLQTNRNKTATDKNDSVYCTTTRPTSQGQHTNRSRNNKSKTMIQTKEEQSSELKNIKCQQLFCVIETFYNTLASLPLQSLVHSSQPRFWIEQQEQTLKELSKKLEKYNKNKDHEYYKWKLNSVQKILVNISENMNMLQRMNHLKGYYSGTDTSNYRSRGSSSMESQQGSLKLGNLATSREEAKQMLSYDHYVIKQNNQRPKSTVTNNSPQLLAETVNSDEEMSSEEEYKLGSRSDLFKKERTRRRTVAEGLQNVNLMNIDKKSYGSSQFLKNKSRQIQLKDKTLTKIHAYKGNQYQKTLTTRLDQINYLQDQMENGQNQQPLLREQNEQKTIEFSKQECTQQSRTVVKDIEKQEFISMIKELRFEIMNKDKQIERLLINQQDYESGLEMLRQREKQKNTQIVFLKENISNNTRQKQRYQAQIKKLLDYQEQLKETIRFQRERNKRQEKEKDRIEQKYYEQASSKEGLLAQISRLKDENRAISRSQRVMKQKLEVYTKKYFKIYKQNQQNKQIEKHLLQELEQIKNNRAKTQSRYDQIREMVEYQKQILCDNSF